MLEVPGFKSAQLFKSAPDDELAQFGYLVIYEFEAESVADAAVSLQKIAGTLDVVMSESMDAQNVSVQIWEAIPEKLLVVQGFSMSDSQSFRDVTIFKQGEWLWDC